MFNKIYENVSGFIKRNYKAILFLIFFYLFMNVKLPYYIWLSGGTIDLDSAGKIEMETSYDYEGSFNLAYVSEMRATIPTYLLSFIIPSWDLVPTSDYQYDTDETISELYNRSKLELSQANQSAVYVAYTKAGAVFSISDVTTYAYYVDPRANSNILVGDVILSINGHDLKSDVDNILDDKKSGDMVVVKLERDGKVYEYETQVYDEDGVNYVGIAVCNIVDYDTTPSIKFNFNSGESGPSGGLTLTLAIYNKLVEEDITKGLKIVGTGTIDMNGTVGEIGGVKYKLKGAVSSGADVFIVPNGDNYDECIKLKDKYNYDIKIIGVDSFDDALEKLSNM